MEDSHVGVIDGGSGNDERCRLIGNGFTMLGQSGDDAGCNL